MEFMLVEGRYRKHFKGEKQTEKRQQWNFSFNKDELSLYNVA